jgi:hypothetical protein
MAFNFGKIGEVASRYFDSDYIDIKRDLNGKLQEVYSNIPCHIAYASTDNPDPTTVDVKPIIQSITVHLQNWVDIRNNDFIIAKKVGSDGSLVATYSGRCGNPVVSQGRKKVLMQMNGTEPEEATPVPPKDSVKITVLFVSDGESIQESRTVTAEAGKPFDLDAPAIDGYSPIECHVNGVWQEGTSAHIGSAADGTEIEFVYVASDRQNYIRLLVRGIYTRDDGSLASGWHQYRAVNADSVSVEDDLYTLTCDDFEETHGDGGQKLSVAPGEKLVLYPGNVFLEIEGITGHDGGKITFTARQFTPTDGERDSYVCHWYD